MDAMGKDISHTVSGYGNVVPRESSKARGVTQRDVSYGVAKELSSIRHSLWALENAEL